MLHLYPSCSSHDGTRPYSTDNVSLAFCTAYDLRRQHRKSFVGELPLQMDASVMSTKRIFHSEQWCNGFVSARARSFSLFVFGISFVRYPHPSTRELRSVVDLDSSNFLLRSRIAHKNKRFLSWFSIRCCRQGHWP